MSKAERDSRQAADDQLEKEEQGQGVAQVHLTSIEGSVFGEDQEKQGNSAWEGQLGQDALPSLLIKN